MRIGTRVQMSRHFGEEQPESTCPDDQRLGNTPAHQVPTGTVVGVKTDCCQDGYLRLTKVQVRWDNGRLTIHDDREADGGSKVKVSDLCDVTPCCFVNIYLHDCCYGGPEEGGWWYDTYEPQRSLCRQYGMPEEASVALEEARVWCNQENQHRRPPSSVCSEGHYVARLEAWPAEPSPRHRPRYS